MRWMSLPRGTWPVIAIVGGVLLAVLAACGGEEDHTPDLAALPTRTPVPATLTSEPADALANVSLIALRERVAAFLDEAEDASPLDRPVLFDQHVFAAHPDCFSDAYHTNTEPLELFDFNLVSLDLAQWREALDQFPEAELIAAIDAALARAVEVIPPEGPFRVCLFPSPPWPHRGDAPVTGAFQTQTLSSDLVVAWCSEGAACLDGVGKTIAFAYHYAVQLGHLNRTVGTTTLRDFMILDARADDFATYLYPGAVFPWHVDLDPALEADLWARMQESLDVTYQDYPEYRRIERFLYGRGTEQYPDWGGIVIGMHIVEAFHENNPLVTYAELAALPSEDVIARSGYAPR